MVQSAAKTTSAIAQSLLVYTYDKIEAVQCSKFLDMKRLLLNGIKTRFHEMLTNESFTTATILNPEIKMGLFDS